MTIANRDRKLLWARAGGTCALCKSYLIADAKGGDKDVVLGEEAHIVSEQLNGPRYRPMPIGEGDAYINLILLCPSDHKLIDEGVTDYTEGRLHAVKREHEQWVKNRISPETELAAQLQLDLIEGESWHIEFKEYDHLRLDEKKIVDSWKDDLSDELAALGSIGGKIYIGISDDGTVKGIGGSHQMWQEKLLERAMGRIKPKVNWKSHYFTDYTTGLKLIRIDVVENEPIYYVMSRPYIREGTRSRPAEPEEVKARFKEYFASREPILPVDLEHPKNDNSEQVTIVSWTTSVLMNILSTMNLYEQKNVNPQLDKLKLDLESSRDSIESNLNKIKRILGKDSDYYQELEFISHEILAATKVRFFLDGGKSWTEWLSHLKKIYHTAVKLLSTVKSSVSITIEGLDEQEEDIKDNTIRWLNSIDDYSFNKFIYEANQYIHMLLSLHFLLWLKNDEQRAAKYKEIADEIERLSWARTNIDYWKIKEAIPELQQKLNTRT